MSRTLSAIVAVCDDWGIGREGDMLVANRADMRHFVRCTKGHTVILGRKTLESFPGGRPLKDRRNIVLTRDASFTCAGAENSPIPWTRRYRSSVRMRTHGLSAVQRYIASSFRIARALWLRRTIARAPRTRFSQISMAKSLAAC